MYPDSISKMTKVIVLIVLVLQTVRADESADPWMCNAKTWQCKKQSQTSGPDWYGPARDDPSYPAWATEDDCDGSCVPTFECAKTGTPGGVPAGGTCPRYPACVGPYSPGNPVDTNKCGKDKIYGDCEKECDTTVNLVTTSAGVLQPPFVSSTTDYTINEVSFMDGSLIGQSVSLMCSVHMCRSPMSHLWYSSSRPQMPVSLSS